MAKFIFERGASGSDSMCPHNPLSRISSETSHDVVDARGLNNTHFARPQQRNNSVNRAIFISVEAKQKYGLFRPGPKISPIDERVGAAGSGAGRGHG
jgi:hypothetical protein